MTNEVLSLSLRASRRPRRSLIHLRHRREAFVDELLQASSFVRFSRIDIAFRIRRDAVNSIELAGLPSAIAETRQHLEIVPLNNINLLVPAIGQINILLLRVL